jgi:hypothetical protein
MKKLITTITCIVFSAVAFAQTPNLLTTKGKNVFTVFPQQLLNNGFYPVFNANNSLYTFGYSRIIGKANAVRFGIKMRSSDGESTRNDTLENNNKSSGSTIGIGYDRYFQLSKAWQMFIGMDLVAQSSKSDNKYSATTYTSISNSKEELAGLYPHIGLVANLNQRISLAMESGFYSSGGNTTSYYKYEYASGKIDENTTKAKGNSMIGIFPNIICRIKI